ncbi:MAG: YceI family protein [Cryomorphaceae bacterium]|nr:YceI family protein [Cryomorphaceae bacterium]
MSAKTTWAIDPTHSEVSFKVKHLVISTVTGYFRNFGGELVADNDNFDGASASFFADIDSIDTNVKDRDTHLKSDDFFNAGKFPKLTFANGSMRKSGEGYKIEGDLTIRDNTQRVTLNADFGGKMVDGYGQTKVGFEISGKISRKAFGLKWDQVTEAGGVVVGDEVKLILNVQFVQK